MLSEFFELGCTFQKEHVLISWDGLCMAEQTVQSLTCCHTATSSKRVCCRMQEMYQITKPRNRHESLSLPDPFILLSEINQ